MNFKLTSIGVTVILITTILTGCINKEPHLIINEETKNVLGATKDEKKLDNKENIKSEEEKLNFDKYINPRFGYSLSYPNKFKITKESDNGDGVELKFEDSKIIVYGSNNVLQDSAKSLYESELNEILKKDLIESFLEKNIYIITWREDSFIKYKKSIVGEESINSFEVVYPLSKEKEFIDLINKISESFKTPNVDKMG